MSGIKKFIFCDKCLFSVLVISMCICAIWYWIEGLWWLQHPQAIVQRCLHLCSYCGIVWAYVGALLFISIGIWAALKPPQGLGFCILAFWWLLMMACFAMEVTDYGQNPRPYPYPLESAFYIQKIRMEVFFALWSIVGVLQTYLKGRKRIWFVVFHSIASILIVWVNAERFFPNF